MKKFLFMSSMTVLVLFACKKESDSNKASFYTDKEDCTTVDAAMNTYDLSVKSILNTSCALSGCHDAATKSSGIELATYEGAKKAFASDLALCAIHHDCTNKMPKGGSKLPDILLKELTCWVANGTPE